MLFSSFIVLSEIDIGFSFDGFMLGNLLDLLELFKKYGLI